MTAMEQMPGLDSHWDSNFRPELQNAKSAFEHVLNNRLFSLGLNIKKLEKAQATGNMGEVEARLQNIEADKQEMINGLYTVKSAIESGKLPPENVITTETLDEIISFLESNEITSRSGLNNFEKLVKDLTSPEKNQEK